MTRYRYDELEVVGVLGLMGEPLAPHVCEPLFAVKGRDIVLIEPFDEAGGSVEASHEVTRGELTAMVADGHATGIDPPAAALSDGCVYVGPSTGAVEYVSLSEALVRIRKFADSSRAEGLRLFRDGREADAIEWFERTASASQEARDYAWTTRSGTTVRPLVRAEGSGGGDMVGPAVNQILRWWCPGASAHGVRGRVVDVGVGLFRVERVSDEWQTFGEEISRRFGLDRQPPFEAHGVGWLPLEDWDAQYEAARASGLCRDVDCYCRECGHRHMREVWLL